MITIKLEEMEVISTLSSLRLMEMQLRNSINTEDSSAEFIKSVIEKIEDQSNLRLND